MRGTNLPSPLTSFVGRDRELRDVRRLVGGHRLVTLVGPAGCGKTRLALEAAPGLVNEYPDGVWLVELAPLLDPKRLAPAVAAVLGIGEEDDRPLEKVLTDVLQARRLLLVLDNCDHLAAACAAFVQGLLQVCPSVTVLATSREALRVPGERVFSVPPLALPPEGASPTAMLGAESVRLFADRARAVLPEFVLTPDHATVVAELCRRLDGIPLAIELAASRIKVLSPQQILGRLDDRFRLLTSGSPTAQPRHRTLHAAIDWSHHLLSEPEEILFRRLGVFAGTFTLAAVEAICTGGGVEPADAVDLLTRLVDKSLVGAVQSGDVVRYRLLESIRHYAIDKLREAGEMDELRGRHRDWYQRTAGVPWARDAHHARREWLDEVEAERENLTAALSWSIQGHEAAQALSLAAGLTPFWRARGYLSEGRRWLAESLRIANGVDDDLRAAALTAAGLLANTQCDPRTGQPLLQEARELFEGTGNKAGLAEVLLNLGAGTSGIGENGRARAYLEQSLVLYRELNKPRLVAKVLNVLGMTAFRVGEYREAARCLEESRALWRQVGDHSGGAAALNNLALVTMLEGDYARAKPLFEECLAWGQSEGNLQITATSHANLGCVELNLGNRRAAVEHLLESLSRFTDLGVRDAIAECLEGLAAVAVSGGEAEPAARLLGAAESLRQAAGIPVDSKDSTFQMDARSSARASLGDAAYARGLTAGRAWTLDEAVAYATSLPAVSARLPNGARARGTAGTALRIFALGPAEVHRGDHILAGTDWTYAKSRELLFYLVTMGPRTKEQIGLDLWPDASPAQLRGNFHTCLHHLRRALGGQEWILFTGEAYTFNRGLNYWSDVEAFSALLDEARHERESAHVPSALEDAVGLYRGEFLEDFSEGDWFRAPREQLAVRYVDALLRLGRAAFEHDQFGRAAQWFERILARDGYHETAHRELIRALVRLGERTRAVRHYEAFVERLRDELSATPDPETIHLAERVRRGDPV
jgi:non-specific serine/threonine protein kinase